MTTALDAVLTKRSYSRVTDEAPDHEELAELIAALGAVSDHSGLRPWRIVALRGDARVRLGVGLAEAAGEEPEKHIAKATRAPLVLALVVDPVLGHKVPVWEQEAVVSGVGHYLTLLLHDAGWGCIWRTGPYTRSDAVRRALGVEEPGYLLGWLYVGGVPEGDRREKTRKPVDLSRHLTTLTE